jgi:hypothetical protein
MFLSYDPKFIFVHIPKTAGTSVSDCLRTVARGKVEYGCLKCSWDHHTTARQFKHRLGNVHYKESFTFSFVRNPWDRMYSWYTMHYQVQKWEMDFKTWLMDFQHIMKNTHLEGEDIVPSQRRSQMDWLTDSEGNIIVDYIGKFENLNNDFRVIQEKLNIKKNLPVKNVTKHDSYKKAYDNEMIDFVYKYSKADIEEFGYEF